MAIHIEPGSVQSTITFTVSGTDAEAVSVVGSFNDWTPGQHTLEPTPDGTLAVTLVVEPEQDLHFRYLDSNGTWFDDPEADAITEFGSVISAARITAEVPRVDTDSEPDTETDQASAAAAEPEARATAPTQSRRTTKQSA